MAASNKEMFSLSSDGVSFEFFNLMWTKDELNFGPSINLPDTIVFKNGTPSNWYFTASNGRVKRKNRQNLMNARIEEAFTKHLLGYDVLAFFIHVASTDEDDLNKDMVAKPMSIEYFDRVGLTDFLYKRRDKSNGILQRFVEPKGVKNEMIRAIWSPKVCLLERSENIHQLHDHRFGLFERSVTFEGPEYYYTSAPLRGPVLAGQIQKICESVVSHISEVTFAQQQVSRMVLNLKVDSRDKIWLLFSTSIRCSGANEDLVNMHMKAPDGDLDGGESTATSKARRDLTRSLVNIDSVIELPEHVNLNPNKSYEKLIMKKRIRCISCAQESMEDLRYPVTYKSVIKHYEHTLQLMTEVAGRSAGNNILDWPPDREIIDAAGGVGFGCLEIVNEYDPLSKPGKMDITKKLEEDELRIPPIIRYIHANLSARSYARCRKDPLFLYKTVTVCEACYLVYAEFTTMLLRLGQDLTKLLRPDPAAVRAATRTLEESSLDRPSSADWRAMSTVNRSGVTGDSINSGKHQSGYILPSKNYKKAKKDAIGLRTHDTRTTPHVPKMIRKQDEGVAGVLRSSQSMAQSGMMGMSQSFDSIAADGHNRRDMALQRGMARGEGGSMVASEGSSVHGHALRYDADDVNKMIHDREKHFFAEVSLNPQLKDQHPLMHLITSQQKLRMVDEQAGVFMSSKAAKAEPVFGAQYGKQGTSKGKPLQAYTVEQPYILRGEIILPSKLRAETKAKKDAYKAKLEAKKAKKKLLRSLNSTEGLTPGAIASPTAANIAGIPDPLASPEGGSRPMTGGLSDAHSDTISDSVTATTISAHDISSKKHSDFLRQTLQEIEKDVVKESRGFVDTTIKGYNNNIPGFDRAEKTKGLAEHEEERRLAGVLTLPELVPPRKGKPSPGQTTTTGSLSPQSLGDPLNDLAQASVGSAFGGSQGSLVMGGGGIPPSGLDTNSAVMIGEGEGLSPTIGEGSGLLMETFDFGSTPASAESTASFDRPGTSATDARPGTAAAVMEMSRPQSVEEVG